MNESFSVIIRNLPPFFDETAVRHLFSNNGGVGHIFWGRVNPYGPFVVAQIFDREQLEKVCPAAVKGSLNVAAQNPLSSAGATAGGAVPAVSTEAPKIVQCMDRTLIFEPAPVHLFQLFPEETTTIETGGGNRRKTFGFSNSMSFQGYEEEERQGQDQHTHAGSNDAVMVGRKTTSEQRRQPATQYNNNRIKEESLENNNKITTTNYRIVERREEGEQETEQDFLLPPSVKHSNNDNNMNDETYMHSEEKNGDDGLGEETFQKPKYTTKKAEESAALHPYRGGGDTSKNMTRTTLPKDACKKCGSIDHLTRHCPGGGSRTAPISASVPVAATISASNSGSTYMTAGRGHDAADQLLSEKKKKGSSVTHESSITNNYSKDISTAEKRSKRNREEEEERKDTTTSSRSLAGVTDIPIPQSNERKNIKTTSTTMMKTGPPLSTVPSPGHQGKTTASIFATTTSAASAVRGRGGYRGGGDQCKHCGSTEHLSRQCKNK